MLILRISRPVPRRLDITFVDTCFKNIEANVPDDVEKNYQPERTHLNLKRVGYEIPSNKKKKQFCDVVSWCAFHSTSHHGRL